MRDCSSRSHCRGGNLLDPGCGRQGWRRYFRYFLRLRLVRGGRCWRLLPLLMATAAPATAPSPAFALLAAFTRRMKARSGGAPGVGLGRRALALGRLLALLLRAFLTAGILLLLTLVRSAPSAVTLTLLRLSLWTLMTLR